LRDTKTKLFGDKMEVLFSKDCTSACPKATLKRLKEFAALRSKSFLLADRKENAVKARDAQLFQKGKLDLTDGP
jgi:hypothetical protein